MSAAKPPSYRLHKPSGQAVVTISAGGRRRDVYLGVHGTEASRRAYARVIAELAAAPAVPDAKPGAGLTVSELLLLFKRHAQQHYQHPDGGPTSELGLYRLALRPVRELYGPAPAADFGPLALKAVRQRLIDAGNSRKVVNRHVGRVKRVWKWAASEELVPAAAFQALATVTGLQAGRSAARERPPVQPVADGDVDATLPFLTRHVRGLVAFQRLTGCRPGEACRLRMCDVDTSDRVWLYRPRRHKTAHRGRSRVVAIGPKAQALLAGFPTADVTAFVFSPAAARAERYAAMRAARKSKVQPSQADRSRPDVRTRPGAGYTPESYAHAVAKAVRRANARRAALAGGAEFDPVRHWHPNQLRHSFATAVRQRHSLEAAQVLLGHARADVTQVYAERDHALAARVAAEVG
jgi:integrase